MLADQSSYEGVSAEVIEDFEIQDQSSGKMVTRAAHRIAAKGFEVIDIMLPAKRTEKIGWGRSSNATILNLHYQIRFVVPSGETFTLFVQETRVVECEQRNPHDRNPPSRKPAFAFQPACKAAKAALGM